MDCKRWLTDRPVWLVLVAGLAWGGPATAWGESETGAAEADPAVRAAEADEDAAPDVLRTGESPAVEPTRGPLSEGVGPGGPQVDVDPSVLGLPPGEATPRARREGAFVVNQPGRVLRPDDGSQWIFQPTRAGDAADDLPPMLVLPSARLEMIETYMHEQDGDAGFEVSGRLHAYRGVNYLLLTQARPQVDARPDDEAESADEPAPATELDDEDDDPMLRALLERRQAAPPAAREQPADRPRERARVVAGSAPGADEAAVVESLRDEGSMVVERRGRVTRSRDGGHVLFVFEADERVSPESPMILQPCRLLESMERIVQQRGEQVTFIVSGQVQSYHGANYLLPTMMRVAPDMGNLRR